MTSCSKAAALAHFLAWTQTDVTAALIASRQQFILATSWPTLQSMFLNQLKEFTCQGIPVSELYECINNGQLCSNNGQCSNNTCVCVSGWQGQYCEDLITSSSSSSLAVALGVTIPVAAVIALIIVGFILVLVLALRYRNNRTDDWEVNYAEIEIGEQLGAGGYGQVYKGVWKGTEVAVKVIAAEKITKEMEKNFKDEVYNNNFATTLVQLVFV